MDINIPLFSITGGTLLAVIFAWAGCTHDEAGSHNNGEIKRDTLTLLQDTIAEKKYGNSGMSHTTLYEEIVRAGKDKDTSSAVHTTMSIDTNAAVKHWPLTITVENLASATAPVIMSVYAPDNKFPDPHGQLKEYRFQPHDNMLVATISDLSYGDFALAMFQDVNGNGKIDKNVLGMPTEPFAFSNNYRPKIRAPRFNDCRFTYDSVFNSITLKLINYP